MSTLQLLIVEDDDQELQVCEDSTIRYCEQNPDRNINLVQCKTVDQALKKFDNSFDGAIIDLKLAGEGDEGNQVTKMIEESFYRIPVAILTGTPENAIDDFTYIGVFKKGEITYPNLFDKFWDIYNTGITRIVGGRGLIEEKLAKVFNHNFLPRKQQWIKYGNEDSARTEKALLRHTLNHLSQLLDDDEGRCFPEEVYLAPPLIEDTRTGSIVKEREGTKWYVVMSPACDLTIRQNGCRNTDRILVAEIETENERFDNKSPNKDQLKAAYENRRNYYHWLPKTAFFDGGFLNFRKLLSPSLDEFFSTFETPPQIQISPPFVKDIIARFSSYYARQGQPDIDFGRLINRSPT